MARHGSKDIRHNRRTNSRFWFDDGLHHFENFPGDLNYDYEELEYWENRNKRLREELNTPRGLTTEQACNYLKEMCPTLRHKEAEILAKLRKLGILDSVDGFIHDDEFLPERLTDIFTSGLPELVDDFLSVCQIVKWMDDDVKKVWTNNIKYGEPGEEDRIEDIKWAKFVMSTYRKGLKSLRRKVKSELEERELKKEVETYQGTGLEITMEEFLNEAEDQAIVTALESAGIRYLFQLLRHSLLEISSISGIGEKRLDRILKQLKVHGYEFRSEEEKKKEAKKEKKKKKGPKIINIGLFDS